ncbi:MAG: hypothetical protein AB1861_18145 [Cyanobacteriota bacterium]
MEAFSARLTSALASASGEAATPLLDDLDHNGKLLMIRLLLAKTLGKKKQFCWHGGQKSGGRNHEKYKYACEILELMIAELNRLEYSEKITGE